MAAGSTRTAQAMRPILCEAIIEAECRAGEVVPHSRATTATEGQILPSATGQYRARTRRPGVRDIVEQSSSATILEDFMAGWFWQD